MQPRAGVRIGPLDLRIDAGERVALLGVNGSGKSTLLRLLAGLAEPAGGRLHCATDNIAFLSDSPPACADRSARELLAEALVLAEAAPAGDHLVPLLNSLLDGAGLAPVAGTRVDRLSLGQRQRLALLLVSATGRDLLLLDEPGNGLDPEQQAVQARQLAADPARTLIVAAHVLTPWRSVLDRALVLDGGRLAYDGPLAGLPSPWREAV